MTRKAKAILTVLVALVLVTVAGTWYYYKPETIATALQNGDYRYAAEELHARRDSDNSLVLNSLANLYYVGLGVKQSYSKSVSLYSEAAFAGNVAAQVNLGHHYANGLGIPMDTQLAYAWFNLARNNGSKIAQRYMSDLLAEHKVNYHFVNKIRVDYAKVDNFPKLH